MFRSFVKIYIAAAISTVLALPSHAQFVKVGDGGYTTQFPGTDAAGRNSFPSGTPYVIGQAATKPIPTNDWWSAQVKNSHTDNLFNYPFTMKTVPQGLVVSYIPWGVIDNILPVIVGVDGLNSSDCDIADHSDWLVEMQWANSGHQFNVTSGIGMPFLYFTKNSGDVARIEVNEGSAVVSNEMIVITDARNGADFAIYAPSGSTWQQNGKVFTSTLNGKNYWSLAFIPLTASNVNAVATEYKKYAYVFPENSVATWSYNNTNSVMTTDFKLTTSVKEGTDSLALMGLLPHQWAHLSAGSPVPNKYEYASIRGKIKTLAGNDFQVEHSFYGILPTLPYLDYYSSGFKPNLLNDKIQGIKNDALNPWTDSYNEGQMMNRLIQSARIAELTGDEDAVESMVKTVKERLEDWLLAEAGERAFLFYYNSTWTTLIGYPAGHGQDNNINDHHFHWGYFIHAAAFMEQMEPGWASKWGDMVNLLIKDAANYDRSNTQFPMLRNFSPYAGHCWANGFASFPQGNDQESTSESMQFNSSLIHWGSVTGNDTIRNLGIYLYTTEQAAIEEYWFDINERVFNPGHPYSLVSRVWGNSYDNGTFWTSDIAASYGIEMYPIHGGSLYLGQDTQYVDQVWKEIEVNTGILKNEENPNLWHDVFWEYLAFIDPEKAIQLYDSYPDRNLKFGISDVQTYHWLHSMNALGRVTKVSSDHPLSAVFSKGGDKTYVVHNYGNSSITVNYSDGFTMQVPAKTLKTSKDLSFQSVLTTPFVQAYPGGSANLTLNVSGGTPSKVEFYRDEVLLGSVTSAPYEFKAKDLPVGNLTFYARVYDGSNFTLSNLLKLRVGDVLPYDGSPKSIPGVLEAGKYDYFQGGNGQGITYQDNTPWNEGDFRESEAVDASIVPNEGATVGWTGLGEWLSYTVDVKQAGNYKVEIRFASGNSNGGGPMYFVLDDDTVSGAISFTHTNGWDKWNTRSVSNVRLKKGIQVLKVAMGGGEFNLGEMRFTYESALGYSQPVANAGPNQLIQLPATTANLDASASTDPQGGTLSYKWTQVYGPSILSVTNPNSVSTAISGLEEGVYLMKLEVTNGTYGDEDEVYLISSRNGNYPPQVSIFNPSSTEKFIEGDEMTITALASDLNGSVDYVDFFVDTFFIGRDRDFPYERSIQLETGNYVLTAKAVDNDGGEKTSSPVEVEFEEAPSCRDTSFNGDFYFEFSDEDNNPTLTFIPSLSGMGSPTCLLYYGTNPSGLPGYPVTPNVPFRLNATEGSTIYFYYTYTHPSGGERNNAANKDSYRIGSCGSKFIGNLSVESLQNDQFSVFPNPSEGIFTVSSESEIENIKVIDLGGRTIYSAEVGSSIFQINLESHPAGLYLLMVQTNGIWRHEKIEVR